ncbi:MAG: Peptidyl-prolyl cis-trans isomerase cyp8 [Vezdaea aestivalis]|nr:MAG: Peptidyl-prolyl cis-trans isomerase cyp8 [Vezdaea aestivalis]
MGKGTDKLYITHSEWSSSDAFSASVGAGVSSSDTTASSAFKRLPYYTCALSLQPFTDPVCTANGTIFDHTHILKWLQKHPRKNPIDSSVLVASDLIPLHFYKSSDNGDFADPVTHKPFTDSTHIVAIRTSGNVFAWDTVDRLNIKAKMWQDLVGDQIFSRKDIITIQDPMNLSGRDISKFQHMQADAKPDKSGRIQKAKEALEKSRLDRSQASALSKTAPPKASAAAQASDGNNQLQFSKDAPRAQHTTGQAAASFTSTGLTPHTSGERALLTDEEFMLRPKRVKEKGYARIKTSLGEINIELYPEFAPKAVWNFVKLAKKGYYRGLDFHRNIKGFMIQGGDPTGSGKGGKSIWGTNFSDEFDGPLTHDARGMLSMANKGKNTNSSQFFITYRAVPHLNRKHTIFGRVIGGQPVLSLLENAPVEEKTNRPTPPLAMDDIEVYIDPFEEFLKARKEKELSEERAKERQAQEESKVTWTGKRIRSAIERSTNGLNGAEAHDAAVGRYLNVGGPSGGISAESGAAALDGDDDVEFEEPPSKKSKASGGGFGDFDGCNQFSQTNLRSSTRTFSLRRYTIVRSGTSSFTGPVIAAESAILSIQRLASPKAGCDRLHKIQGSIFYSSSPSALAIRLAIRKLLASSQESFDSSAGFEFIGVKRTVQYDCSRLTLLSIRVAEAG